MKVRTVTHRGLVVLAGPLRDQLRQARQHQLQALQEQLAQVRADIGQPRLCTLKALQRRVNSRLRTSPVGHLIETQVYTNPQGQLQLTWQVNTSLLAQEERRDGRYLLVTNNWSPLPCRALPALSGKGWWRETFPDQQERLAGLTRFPAQG